MRSNQHVPRVRWKTRSSIGALAFFSRCSVDSEVRNKTVSLVRRNRPAQQIFRKALPLRIDCGGSVGGERRSKSRLLSAHLCVNVSVKTIACCRAGGGEFTKTALTYAIAAFSIVYTDASESLAMSTSYNFVFKILDCSCKASWAGPCCV